MEKNIYKYVQVVIISIFICCATTKNENMDKIVTNAVANPCRADASCEEKLICHRAYFENEWYIPKEADTLIQTYNKNGNIINTETIRDILWRCAFAEVSRGNINAHQIMLHYYQDEFERSKKKNEGPSMIAYDPYQIDVRVFGALRGKDAFELALRCAGETVEIPWSDTNHGGNTGLNVLTFIIFPMIKSVDGYADLDEYLLVDKFKNRSCTSDGKLIPYGYRMLYCELNKAYKEGKIVLKKYGEE